MLPGDADRGALHAGLLSGCDVEELRLEAFALRPSLVHPRQHLRPVRGVGPTSARGDRHDGVALVVRTIELQLEHGYVDLGPQPCGVTLEIREQGGVTVGELVQRCEIARTRVEGSRALDVLAHALEPLQHSLSASAVRPQVRILYALTEFAELAL